MLAKVLLLTVVLLSLSVQGKSVTRQGNAAIRRALARNTGPYTLRASSFVGALTAVAGRFHIPMGIEWVETPGAKAEVRISWKKATVLGAIEDVVKTQPGYEAEVRDGVVHVLAPDAVPNSENFLRLRLSLFQVDGEPVEMASRRLAGLVKARVAAAKHLTGPTSGVGSSLSVEMDSPPLSLHLTNVSVGAVLDAFVKASNRGVWIVTFSSSPGLTPKGFRRTLSLWNDFPVPDDEQPVWDLVHWGDRVLPSRTGRHQ